MTFFPFYISHFSFSLFTMLMNLHSLRSKNGSILDKGRIEIIAITLSMYIGQREINKRKKLPFG